MNKTIAEETHDEVSSSSQSLVMHEENERPTPIKSERKLIQYNKFDQMHYMTLHRGMNNSSITNRILLPSVPEPKITYYTTNYAKANN